MRAINADDIPYTMLYKEGWMRGTGVEKQAAWKDDIDAMPTIKLDVTHCKDCKHFHQGEPYSMCYRTPYPYIVDGDKDYCSFVDEGR